MQYCFVSNLFGIYSKKITNVSPLNFIEKRTNLFKKNIFFKIILKIVFMQLIGNL